MKQYAIAGLAVVLTANGWLMSAPPASAGCENAQLLLYPTAQKCDGALQPDGTWQRCVVYYDDPPKSPPSQSDCHLMGPGTQTFAHSFFDPPTHIDP